MGVANHRSCSHASDPLEDDLNCRVMAAGRNSSQNAMAIKYRIQIRILLDGLTLPLDLISLISCE